SFCHLCYPLRRTSFHTHAATTQIYTLSLHDALPISSFISLWIEIKSLNTLSRKMLLIIRKLKRSRDMNHLISHRKIYPRTLLKRSEEHTSELQSRFDLVCRLLLEKKKNQRIYR